MLTVGDIPAADIDRLLARFGLRATWVGDNQPVRGSFWGAPEAGIAGKRVFVRDDTPVHSMLHETCHIICMSDARRERLQRDAGSDDPEETAVCYLQVLLADLLPGVGRERLMQDMDSWGYSFRLGSTARWFAEDADDARRWLRRHELIDDSGRPQFRLRNE